MSIARRIIEAADEQDMLFGHKLTQEELEKILSKYYWKFDTQYRIDKDTDAPKTVRTFKEGGVGSPRQLIKIVYDERYYPEFADEQDYYDDKAHVLVPRTAAGLVHTVTGKRSSIVWVIENLNTPEGFTKLEQRVNNPQEWTTE